MKFSVFLAGACIMSAEMAAPRLLAPSFGTTQIIWANIIGTVLAAMTAGAFIGGRLADRWPTEKAYGRAMMLGGFLLAIVPIVSTPLLHLATGALASKAAGTFLLSLAAVCFFFAPPVFVLGMISPWAVRLAGSGKPNLGRIAGELSALGAAGSILGTFFSALVLLPTVGTRTTLLTTAAVLIITGALGAFRSFYARGALAASAGLVVLTPLGDIKQDPTQIFEQESAYQYIQVKRSDTGRTRLQLNEGVGSHSVKPAKGYITRSYWDNISVLASMVSGPGEPLRVLILGLAAGTMAWQLDHYYAGSRQLFIEGVEIDGAVVEVGRSYFDLDKVKNLKVHVADGRPFIQAADGEYDLIVADAFQQPYIPFHMVTEEFYRACAARLAPGGAFVINLGANEAAHELITAFKSTLKAVFPKVSLFVRTKKRRTEYANYLFVGSQSSLELPSADDLPADLSRTALPEMVKTWREIDAPEAGFIFTDNHAPIESFVHGMLLDAILKPGRGSKS